MATSGITEYTLTTNDIIRDALINLELMNEQDDIPGDMFVTCLRTLNLMIKAWQTQEFHLQLEAHGYMFLVSGQSKYIVGGSSASSHMAANLQTTTITTAGAISDTTIYVTSSADFTNGQAIGVTLDDGSIQWTTVSSKPTATTIIIGAALTDTCAINNNVFGHTAVMGRTMTVSQLQLHRADGSELPINKISETEYFNYVNKITTGTPNVYYVDKQSLYDAIYFFPVPDGTCPYAQISYKRIVENFNGPTDTPDWPDEWGLPLSLNLSVLVAPKYGKSAAISAAVNGECSLSVLASQYLQALKEKQCENADVNLYPNLYFYNYN